MRGRKRERTGVRKRLASLLMCAAVVAASLQLPEPANAAELPADLTPEEAFVLKDENLECGDNYWTMFSMIWDGYTTQASFTPEADGMKIQVDDVGANGAYAGLWTVALNQNAMLYAGRTYKISFDLTSSIARSFEFGVEKNDESKERLFNQLTGIKAEEVGTPKTFTYEYTAGSSDFDGKFYINVGAPDKGVTLDAHTIKVSNVRMEVEGARDKWILVNDPDFTQTDRYTVNGGSLTNGYLSLDAGGTITYPNLNVTAGETYELTFAARTNDAASLSASAGGSSLTANEPLEQYTNQYTYEYTAEQTGVIDLKLAASGNGKVFVDNVCFGNAKAKNALGLNALKADLDADGVLLQTTAETYPVGSDVELTVTADDFNAWLAASPRLLLNGKAADEALYTIADGRITIKAAAFSDVGRYSVAVVTPGYAKSGVSIKVVKADGNLIENGDFEDGFTAWTPFFNERYSGSAEITADFMAKFTMNFLLNWYDGSGADLGPVTWSTMLTHTDVPVRAARKYTMRFWASSTVERPIKVEIGGEKHFFVLTPELQEFSLSYNNEWGTDKKIPLSFHLGKFTEASDPANDTGIYFGSSAGTDTIPHTMYLTDISMMDTTDGEAEYKKTPTIIGIDNGAEYKAPVSATVNYRKAHTVTLTRNGSVIAYTMGDMIKDDGEYVLTVADQADPTVKSEKKFSIRKKIDYTKEYFAISSKATEKVIEAVGIQEGGAVVQSTFKGKPGQLFTLEDVKGGYFIIRALSSDRVIQVADASADNGAKLEQGEYTGANHQLWKKVSVPQGFVKLENKASGKVIDISNAMKTENLPLQQYDNSGNTDEGQSSADGQRFDLIRITDVRQYMENVVPQVQTEADWKEHAFLTPHADKLNPAGPIAVEWYSAPGAVKSYDIYFDGKKCKNVAAADTQTLKTEDHDIYSVDVAAHTMKLVANYDGGKTVESKEIKFYITKKGVGWATLHRTEDMNLSWYYHWALDPALGTSEDLAFVPMIWGNYGDEWLADPANKKYGTVLSFNEPDWSDQSNVPVTKKLAQEWVNRYNAANGTNDAPPKSVEEAWQSFMDSGLRVGSPATALAPPYCNGSITMNDVDGPDNWWFDFQKLMDDNKDKGWDYDFVAIHSYNDGCDAEGFLRMVDETYRLTGKPIWITEFGVATWGSKIWQGNNPATQKKVKDFLITVINGLEERDYVERYAWFPFDPNDAYGGASGIFNYATGELNELGQTYAMLGLPEGYEGADYDVDISTDIVSVESVTIAENAGTVKVGNTLQLSATIAPANATTKTVTWSSSDSSIASVDKTGKVTPYQAGKVTITAAAGGKRAEAVITVTDEPKPVTGITVDKTKTELYVGDSMKLNVTLTPSDATNKKLSYSMDNQGIVSINETTGVITALKAGTVGITVKAYNNMFDTVSIVVKAKPVVPSNVKVSAIRLPSVKIIAGQKVTANAVLTGGSGIVTWRSSNEAAAIVNSKGEIKGVAAGRATIYATCGNSTKGISIRVVKPTVRWNVSYKTCPLQLKKSTTALKAVGLQKGDKILSYISSNKKIVAVSRKGKLVAKKPGTAKITVKTRYGAKAVIRIKVQKTPVKVTAVSVNKSKITLKKGKTFQLIATKKYITSTYKVRYTSSNKKVATVSSRGKIKAKKKGTVSITVKCQNKTKKVKVIVK